MNHGTTDVAIAPSGHPGTVPLDLQQFCGVDECRYYLMKPFSRDGFTWATNGHVLVRVPQRSEYPDIDSKIKINIAAPLKGHEAAKFFKPAFELPPAHGSHGSCEKCSGRGYLHDCPDCDCECSRCDGSGISDSEHFISVSVGPTPFALNYIRQILSLPSVELQEFPPEQSDKPYFFRFEGEGLGAVMPLRSQRAEHVDINLRTV